MQAILESIGPQFNSPFLKVSIFLDIDSIDALSRAVTSHTSPHPKLPWTRDTTVEVHIHSDIGTHLISLTYVHCSEV